MPQGNRNTGGGAPIEQTCSNSAFEPQSNGTRGRRVAQRGRMHRDGGAANFSSRNNRELRERQLASRSSERPATLNQAQTDPMISTYNRNGDDYEDATFGGNRATNNRSAVIGNVRETRDNTRVQVSLTTNFHGGSSDSLPADPPTRRTEATDPTPFGSPDQTPIDTDEGVARGNAYMHPGPQHGYSDSQRGRPPSRVYRRPPYATGHDQCREGCTAPTVPFRDRWEGLWSSSAPTRQPLQLREFRQSQEQLYEPRQNQAEIITRFDQMYWSAAPTDRYPPAPGLAPEYLVLLGVGIMLPFFTVALVMKR